MKMIRLKFGIESYMIPPLFRSCKFWDFDGSKPDSVNVWYNVIAEDDLYTFNDFVADIGGNGEKNPEQ